MKQMLERIVRRAGADRGTARARLDRWRVPALAIGLVALTALVVAQRWRGLGPPSFWLDDQWVVALIEHASLGDLVTLAPPVPIGFVCLQKLVAQVAGTGELTMQMLPFILGVAQIALVGWVAYRATGLVSLGLFAATLLAGSRLLAVHSLRVKQFSVEGFVALVLIALAVEWARRPSPRALAVLLAAAALALPLSFTAAPVGLVVVNAVVLHALLARADRLGGSRRGIVLGAAAYDVLVLIWIVLVLSPAANPAIVAFWDEHYLPLGDVAATWSFMTTQVTRFIAGAVPDALWWLALAVPAAIAVLAARPGTRTIGLALALFYVGMLSASALHMYPLGGRRTDVFSYPITVLAVTAAIWAVSRRFRWAAPIALAIAAGELLLLWPGAPLGYPASTGRRVVEQTAALAQPADAIVVAPRTNWAVGCYGPWPVRLEPARDSTNAFFVQVDRPLTVVLRESLGGIGFQADPAVVHQQLVPILSLAPRRVFYITQGDNRRVDAWVIDAIEARGYTATSAGDVNAAAVRQFDAASRPIVPGPRE